jgi:hypothetical protein
MSFAAASMDNIIEELEPFEDSEAIISAEELDPGTISDAEEILQVQDIIDDADDDEESSALEADSVQLEIKWDPLVCIVEF